jgi:hypothetical protein
MFRDKKGELVAGIGGAFFAVIIGTEIFDSSNFGGGDDYDNDYTTNSNNGYGNSCRDGTYEVAIAGNYSSSCPSNCADIDRVQWLLICHIKRIWSLLTVLRL